jgi:tRNA-specific 2-thiouridylase
MSKKIVVGMSGGVDSSVTAYLLQKEGYEVIGVYMRLHNLIDKYHDKNIESGKRVADFLGIQYHILDLSDKFKEEVYDYFVSEYEKGNTPNPCVKCNRTIKFGALLDFTKNLGADYLATGHYAKTDGKFIYEADDKSKDQSYFLGQIKQDALKHIIFPMSKYKKEDIIKLGSTIPAIKDIAQGKESQEICFVDTVYTDILKKHHSIDNEGKTLDIEGNEIGHHKGYMHYTIGKRKGFYVHGAHEPHFVKELNPKDNTIVVCKKEELYIFDVQLENLNLFIDEVNFDCTIKLRYRTTKIACNVTIIDDVAKVKLKEPAFGVACGQVAVFYQDEKVLGSGWIAKTFSE